MRTLDLSLLRDAVLHAARRAYGMLPSGLLVSFDQNLVAGVHKEDLIFVSLFPKGCQHLFHIVEGFVRAHVQSQDDLVYVTARRKYKLHEGVDQADRQIVHAIIAHILQKADRGQLPASAHACNYNKSHIFPFCRPRPAAGGQNSPRKITSLSS